MRADRRSARLSSSRAGAAARLAAAVLPLVALCAGIGAAVAGGDVTRGARPAPDHLGTRDA